MTGETLRVGVIGANPERGWASAAHLPALPHLPSLALSAVATTKLESAREAARRFGAMHAFGDWRELVASPEVDIVIVAVKVPQHRELTLAAIDAGKHVFCEWPLGLSAAEAEEMLRAAEAKGVRHMVGLQAEVHPVLAHMRDLVAAGEIGEVMSATLTSSLNNWIPIVSPGDLYRVDRSFGATGLTVPGGHTLAALTACLGPFAEVCGIVTSHHERARVAGTEETVPITAPTQVMVTGRLKSGAVAAVHVKADIFMPTGARFEINGTRGDLIAATRPPVGRSPVGIQRVDLTLEGAFKGSKGFAPIEVPPQYRLAPESVPAGAPFYTAQLLTCFAASIRAGKGVPPDFGTALRLHRLIEAIEKASETGVKQAVGG